MVNAVDDADLAAVREQLVRLRRREGEIAAALGWEPRRVRAAVVELRNRHEVTTATDDATGEVDVSNVPIAPDAGGLSPPA